MKTSFSIAGVELHLGDAQDLSQRFAGTADMVLSDPPYTLTSGGRVRPDTPHRVMGGIFATRVYDNSGLLMAVPSWGEIAEVCARLAARNCEGYFMAHAKHVAKAQAAFEGQGWKFHNLLPWDKTSPTPNKYYMQHMEFTLYMWKGRARTINHPGSKQLFAGRAPRGKGKIHPTEKPVALMAHYILNSTGPGQMVIDPYAGSASTLVAAALNGRRAMGFEIDAEKFERAAERLRRDLGHLA